MEIQSFNKELQIANLQFMRLFNNIRIVSGGKETRFQCVLGGRSRILKNLENPTKNSMYKLPLIIVDRTGITKNNDRITNLNNEVKYQTYAKKLNYDLFTPVPIDISYEVTIMSKYQDHIDRCLGNFIPFFNKDLYVRCEHPKFSGVEYTNQVVMEDSINMERNEEIDPTQDDIITCTCNFTFKTYMFCGNQKSNPTESYIRQIVDTIISCDPVTNTSSIVSVITDTEYVGFVPQINQINLGFYPVPLLSTYTQYYNFVGQISGDCPSAIVENKRPYYDGFYWKIDETGISYNLSNYTYN